MFSGNKKSEKDNIGVSLRRRFHHLMIEKRKGREKEPLSKYISKSPLRRKRLKTFWDKLNSPESKRLRGVLGLTIIGGTFIGIAYVVFFSSFFIIKQIDIEKNGNAVPETALTNYLEKLKGKNILFISTNTLVKEIEQTFKNEILLVETRRDYPRRIVATIEEYPAVMNLRVITPEKTQKFIINQIGYSIIENSEQKNLPTLILRTTKPLTGKSILIDKERLNKITNAFNKFTEIFGMKIVEGELKKIERELHLKTERGFAVWLDLTSDTDKQILKLKKALPHLDIYHENLEYIDLRISSGESEKVIYKRK